MTSGGNSYTQLQHFGIRLLYNHMNYGFIDIHLDISQRVFLFFYLPVNCRWMHILQTIFSMISVY